MINATFRSGHGTQLRRWLLVASAAALLPLAGVIFAQQQSLKDRDVTMATLLDRIQIEDFITRYYYDLSVGKAHELAEYFTEDAVLDVDGVVAKGHAEIAKLYTRPAGEQSPAAKAQYRRGNMLLTNPIINVEGNVARTPDLDRRDERRRGQASRRV